MAPRLSNLTYEERLSTLKLPHHHHNQQGKTNGRMDTHDTQIKGQAPHDYLVLGPCTTCLRLLQLPRLPHQAGHIYTAA